jgi:hypothetical protein
VGADAEVPSSCVIRCCHSEAGVVVEIGGMGDGVGVGKWVGFLVGALGCALGLRVGKSVGMRAWAHEARCRCMRHSVHAMKAIVLYMCRCISPSV